MEVTKGYKKTEVGVIPEDWGIFKLKEVTENIFSGKSKTLSTNGRYKIFGSTGVIGKSNTFDYQGIKILIARVGANAGTIYEVSGNYKVSDNTLIVEIKKKINFRFIFFILKSYNLNSLIYGSGQPLITGSLLKKLTIPLPPIVEEQKAIADALSDADELIESLDELIVKKEAIKKGAMQELLRPKEDWVRIILDDEIDVNRGGSPRPIQDYITDSPNGVNWIKIGDTNSKSKYITSAKEKIKENGVQNSRQVQVGDFLLSNSMSFGRPYILKIDGCIHDGWLVLQNYQESFDREFLYYTLTSKDVLNQYMSKASGSGVLNLNKQLVKTVELNKPRDVSEQTRIASILKDMDDEIDMLKVKREKAKQIKEGMMQELLTGKTRLV